MNTKLFPCKSFNRDILKHLKVGVEKTHKLYRFDSHLGKPKENNIFRCPFSILSVDSDTRRKKNISALKRKCHLIISVCGGVLRR